MCIFFFLKSQKCIFFFLKIVRSSFSFFQNHCLIPKYFGTVFENVGEIESGAGAFFVSHLLCCLLLLKHALSCGVCVWVRGCVHVRTWAWVFGEIFRGVGAFLNDAGSRRFPVVVWCVGVGVIGALHAATSWCGLAVVCVWCSPFEKKMNF